MELYEAAKHIGKRVVYNAYPGKYERGVIVKTNRYFVFVQYDDGGTKATSPDNLRLENEWDMGVV